MRLSSCVVDPTWRGGKLETYILGVHLEFDLPIARNKKTKQPFPRNPGPLE